MNNVSLVGRLTKDPEMRYTAGENSIAVAKGSIAVDRKFKRDGEQTADFINYLAFGKTAEFIEKYFFKGMRMGLNGHIQTGSYTNKDGVKVYTTDVIADNVEFVESKQNNSAPAGNKNNNAVGTDDFMNIPDGIEDGGLPFN